MEISAYTEKPQVSFKDQEDGEIVFLLIRRHFVTNIPWILAGILIALVPILFLLTPYSSIFPILTYLPTRFLIFFLIVWYLCLLGFLITSFASWFFNIDLVTDRRILDVDYWGFLFFNVSETPLANIQDLTYNISGLSQTIFNYGNIYVQTAGTAANFEFTSVPHPAVVHDLITDVMQGKNVKS